MKRVRIYQGVTPTDAYLVRDWLARNGVTSEMRGESLMGLHGQVPVTDSFPSLWVDASDEERAASLVREFEGPALVHPEWHCSECSELNPPNFGSCWSCGADRPGLHE